MSDDRISGRVLVTGAGGFIGSHLVEMLARQGHVVRALVHYNGHGSLGWLGDTDAELRKRLEILLGDIRDRDIVEQAVRGCDTVFHLAALISIPYSYRAAESYAETNLRGTLNVLEAARRHGVRRVVQTSTSEVYGTAQFVPMTEDHPLSAQSPYAASKIAADQMALAFHRSHGVPVTILRPFNTFGPRQSPRAVIPTIMTQAAAGAKTIRLGALEPTRDFTYVEDTASAFIAVAGSPATIGETVNAGSGRETSIGDLARVILAMAGSNATVESLDERRRPDASEVHRLFAGIDKIGRLTGWRPRYGDDAGFRKALETTYAWFTGPAGMTYQRSREFML